MLDFLHPRGRRLLTTLILLAGTTRVTAHPDDVSAGLFPEAVAPVTVERRLTVPLAINMQVGLVSVRFSPKPGQTPWVAAKWCGLVVADAGKPRQVLLTIGTGSFEALSCTGLKAAGVMPPSGPAHRIGLLYRTRSPNYASTTPLVIVEDVKSGWKVDGTVTDRLNALQGEPTLGRLWAALAQQ